MDINVLLRNNKLDSNSDNSLNNCMFLFRVLFYLLAEPH